MKLNKILLLAFFVSAFTFISCNDPCKTCTTTTVVLKNGLEEDDPEEFVADYCGIDLENYQMNVESIDTMTIMGTGGRDTTVITAIMYSCEE